MSRIQLQISVMLMVIIAGALALTGCETPTSAPPLTLRIGIYASQDVARKINLLRWPLDARTDAALLDQTWQVLPRAGILQRRIDTRRIRDETLLAEVLKETR